MKVGIVGSRSVSSVCIEEQLPHSCTEIISGGARGVDACAAEYARAHGIHLTEFHPNYARYGRAAPIIRNKQIVEHADYVIAYWDGCSKGTLSVIEHCRTLKKPYTIIATNEKAEASQ